MHFLQIYISDFFIKLLAAFGGVSAIVLIIAFIFKGALLNLITNWLNREFLERNTEITEAVRTRFAQTLSDYKLELDRQLTDYKQHTDKELARQVEPIKSALNKGNIAFQITHAEYIKRQFAHVEDLYSMLFKLQRYVVTTYTSKIQIDEKEVEAKDISTLEHAHNVGEKLYASSFFLSKAAVEAVSMYVNKLIELQSDYEDYWRDAKSLKYTSYDEQEHKAAIEASQVTRKIYQDKRTELAQQFGIITRELKQLMQVSIADSNATEGT